jgi:hypothetical protein
LLTIVSGHNQILRSGGCRLKVGKLKIALTTLLRQK